MMKKLYIKSLSVCLVLILTFSLLFVPNVFAETTKAVSNSKIDSRLVEMLSEMDSDDTVHVSIWFDDIDHDIIKEKTKERFENARSRRSLDSTAIRILDCDVNAEIVNEFRDDTYIDDVQEIIGIKRGFSASAYSEHNNLMKEIILKEISVAEENIIYVGVLTPNIEANLTKTQVCKLADSEMVTDIYAVEETKVNIEVEEEKETRATSSNAYSQHQYAMTGLNITRDDYDLNGTGVNIGVFDTAYINQNYLSQHYDTTIEAYSYPNTVNANLDVNNHTYNILSLISGYVNNGVKVFEGGAPGANIYIANENSQYYTSNWKSCIEWLMVVKNCNVINMSRGLDTDLHFVYGSNAKWIDHIATYHNVHFVMASGNQSANLDTNFIGDSATAYNAIVVGSAHTDGNVHYDSCYSMMQNGAYKPELIAPGTEITLPTSNGNAIRGTSFAAPLVTCAVAQLCQASSILRYNPPLMKAVLMSGAKYTSNMDNRPHSTVGGTNIAMTRDYGVGLLFVPNSYISFVVNGYYKTGTMSPYSAMVTKTVTVNQTGKLFRAVAAWDKTVNINGNHSGYVDDEGAEVIDGFRLTVETPSGKKYNSYYAYDTKQVVAFMTEETGTYEISLVRVSTSNSNKIIEYGISGSVISVPQEES